LEKATQQDMEDAVTGYLQTLIGVREKPVPRRNGKR
jgi:hypothetical protein